MTIRGDEPRFIPVSVRSAARKPTVKLRARAAVSTAILEAAEQVAAERGLDATSTSAIAERAGVAVGTLYNYFVDREGLVSALFKWRRDQIIPAILAAADATRALPFEHRLRRYLTGVVEVFESYRQFIRVAMSADQSGIKIKGRNPPAVLGSVTNELEDILSHVSPDRAGEYAHMLFGGLKGLLNWRVENNQPMVPDAALVVDTFLSGMMPR